MDEFKQIAKENGIPYTTNHELLRIFGVTI